MGINHDERDAGFAKSPRFILRRVKRDHEHTIHAFALRQLLEGGLLALECLDIVDDHVIFRAG